MRLKSIVGTSKDDTGTVRFGPFWKVGQWDRENATAAYIKQLKEYAEFYGSQDPTKAQQAADRYAAFLSSSDQSLVQDADLLREAIDNGNDYVVTLDNIAKKKQEAIKQNTGFTASMKNLGNIMKSVGASLLSGIATAAITGLINWGLSELEKQINAAKYAKEALQEVSAEWDELAEKQKSAGDLVAKYEKDYERLSRGVNMVTGENLSLTDDEYELFKQINSELADSALASVEGVTVAYDAQGQAIVRLSGQMDSLSDAYKQLEQQARNDIIARSEEVLEQTQNAALKKGSTAERLEAAQWIMDQLQQEQVSRTRLNGMGGMKVYQIVAQEAGWDSRGKESFAEYLMKPESKTKLAATITKLEAELETALRPAVTLAQAVAENIWDSAAYSDMSAQMRTLGLSYFTSVDPAYYSRSDTELIADAEAFAHRIADPNLQTALENLYNLQTQFTKGDISYGDYMSRSNVEARKFVSDQMPDLFEQLIMEAFGLDGATSYDRSIQRLRGIVTDVSEQWLTSLTADQLNFAQSLDSEQLMTQSEFVSAYAESVKEAALAVNTLTEKHIKLTESQATAAEILADVGTSGALTLEQYEKLIAANKDYADAVDTSTGYLTVNWQKLREINKAQLAQQEATHREVLAANIAKQAELRSEFDQLFGKSQLEALNAEESTRLDLLEKELNVLIKEGNQLKTNLSNIKYMNSAYKQWLDAQEAGEKSDAFVAAKEAIEQIREGDKSGRRNTNKYQAALEYILGDEVYRSASKVSRDVALKRAESWYDSDGNFDLSAFRKSSIEAGAQTAAGAWAVNSIAEYAKLMGVSQEYMAQAILALSEYNGFEGVNVSQALQDQAKELMPTDPVDANTAAIDTNTEALQQLSELLAQEAAAQKEANSGVPATAPASGDNSVAPADESNAAAETQKTIDALLALANKNLDLRIQQTAIDAAEQLTAALELLNEMPQDGYIINVQNGDKVADAQAKLTEIDAAITNIKALSAAGVIPAKVSAELIGNLQSQWEAITKELEEYDSGAKKTEVSVTVDPDQAKQELNDFVSADHGLVTLQVALDQGDVNAVEAEIARLQAEWGALGKPEYEEPYPDHYTDIKEWLETPYEFTYQRVPGTTDQYSPVSAYNMNTGEVLTGELLTKLLRWMEQDSAANAQTVDTEKADQALVDKFLEALPPSDADNPIAVACEQAAATFEDVVNAFARLRGISDYETAYDELMTEMIKQQRTQKPSQESGDDQLASEADIQHLRSLVAAVKAMDGDLSEALNALGMTYDQAEALAERTLLIPEGANPLEQLQNFLEGQTGLEVLVGANTDSAIQTADAAVETINKKTAYITVKTRLLGAIGGLKAFAKGTRNAPGGLSMVGEAGDEIVVDRKDGTWFLAHYPQLVDLNPGDIVLNNEETQKAMKGKQGLFGRAYAVGTGKLSSQFSYTAFDGNAGGNRANTNGTNDDPPKYTGPNYGAILEKFEQLHDWIERALEVAQKKTQTIIDNVKDFVGYIAQNKQVDKALQLTRKEIELNQQAYVRYMQQAADVQDQLDLSDEIVQKIHEGVIDIESYDETTQKKIAEYQEWYEKAENCKDAIEELKDQERELQLQRIDHILEDYENRLDYISDQSARTQREIEYQKAVGIEVQQSSYEDLIAGEQKKIAALQRERAALESEFNALVTSGVIQVGSEDWHKYRNEIEGVDEAIHDATISAQEFADEIYNLNLSKLQNLNKVLQSIQSSTEGIMSLHDAQGTKNVSEYYETLILNGHDQIANLNEQNDLIREQMKGLDKDSEKYQELLNELTANEEAITGIKVSQEQWNDSIADLRIESLQEERETLEKTNEAYQKQLDLEEALEALAKAKSQRTKLVYREGRVMPLYAVMRIETSQSIG